MLRGGIAHDAPASRWDLNARQRITLKEAASIGSAGVAVDERRLRRSDVSVLVPLRHSQSTQQRVEVIMPALPRGRERIEGKPQVGLGAVKLTYNGLRGDLRVSGFTCATCRLM
jgi:hypothetical protein